MVMAEPTRSDTMEMEFQQVRIPYLRCVLYETVVHEENGETVVPDAPEAGFIETLAAAGLGSPFDPTIYTALSACLSEALGLTD